MAKRLVGSCASGVTIAWMIVSTTRPCSSTTKIARATPTNTAAYAIDLKPSTNASAVPLTPRPPTRPTSTPINRNSAESSSKPHEDLQRAEHVDREHHGQRDQRQHMAYLETCRGLLRIVFRRDARPRCVTHRGPHPQTQRRYQHGDPEPHARQQRELGETLCDADVERVERAERAAHSRSAQTHGDDGEGIESNATREEHQHRDERDDLFPHAFDDAAGREEERDDRNDRQCLVPEAFRQPVNCALESTGCIDDAERAAGKKDEKDDRAGVDHPFWHRDQRLERTERTGRDSVIRARNDDRSAGGCILTTLEFARGNDVAENRRDGDARHQQHEWMRHARGGHRATVSWLRFSPSHAVPASADRVPGVAGHRGVSGACVSRRIDRDVDATRRRRRCIRCWGVGFVVVCSGLLRRWQGNARPVGSSATSRQDRPVSLLTKPDVRRRAADPDRLDARLQVEIAADLHRRRRDPVSRAGRDE